MNSEKMEHPSSFADLEIMFKQDPEAAFDTTLRLYAVALWLIGHLVECLKEYDNCTSEKLERTRDKNRAALIRMLSEHTSQTNKLHIKI